MERDREGRRGMERNVERGRAMKVKKMGRDRNKGWQEGR